MNVGSVGASAPVAAMPEKMEGPGPDHDGDKDDMAAAISASASKPAAPQGMGLAVDKMA